jgi:hypothetical protein
VSGVCRVILEVDANVIAQRVTMRTEGAPEVSYAEHVCSCRPCHWQRFSRTCDCDSYVRKLLPVQNLAELVCLHADLLASTGECEAAAGAIFAQLIVFLNGWLQAVVGLTASHMGLFRSWSVQRYVSLCREVGPNFGSFRRAVVGWNLPRIVARVAFSDAASSKMMRIDFRIP